MTQQETQQALVVPTNRSDTQQVNERLTRLIERLGERLEAAAEDATSLHIATYVSNELDTVTFNTSTGAYQGPAYLRAETYMSIDGDLRSCVPLREDGAVDTELWAIHTDLVQQARQHRQEMLKTVFVLARALRGLEA